MKLTKDMRILCCCRRGQCRSVSARALLADEWGFRKVLACGLESNDEDTLSVLFEWADAVLVIGSQRVKELLPSSLADHPAIVFMDVGADIWHDYRHPELVKLIGDRLEKMVG